MKRSQVPVLLVFMFGWFLSGCGGSPAPTNTDPIAVNDTATVTQGGAALTIDVLANDTDADHDTLTIKSGSVTAPNHGGTAVIANNKITYTPPADYRGTETFRYTVSDGNGGEDNATVTVTIQAANANPVANNDAADAIRGGAALTIDVLANDTDADHDTLTIKSGSVTAPNHGGTAVIAGNKITYTPPADFSGAETFQYTISDGNGGEAAATVTVTLSKKWDDPVLIESDGGDAENPDIAVDSQGNAFVVWEQNDGSQSSIFANRFDVANGWDDNPTLLEHNNSGSANEAKVAADSEGNAYAVWVQKNSGNRHHIYGNKYTAISNGWDNNRTAVDTNSSHEAYMPGIGTSLNDNNHSVFVAWHRDDNSVWVQRNDEAAVQIETNSSLQVWRTPQVAVDALGNAFVVWTQENVSGVRHIFASRYDVHDGNWTAVIPVDEGAGEAVRPQIAIDSGNNPIIVWSQYDSATGHYNIYAKRCTDESTCTLVQLDHHDTSDADYPRIATDTAGNAFVVWWDDNGTRASIYANHYTAGSGWDTAATLLEHDDYDVTSPDIATDARGNAYVVWGQDNQASAGWYVDVNRFSADTGTWEGREQITTIGTGVAEPKIAVDSDGNAFTVWSQSDGAYDSIYSSRYW